MIRVTVELVPHGDETRKRTLSSMKIANDGTGNTSIGNYDITLYNYQGVTYMQGRVLGHKRQDYSVWKLISKALEAVGHGTNVSK